MTPPAELTRVCRALASDFLNREVMHTGGNCWALVLQASGNREIVVTHWMISNGYEVGAYADHGFTSYEGDEPDVSADLTFDQCVALCRAAA